MFKMKPVFVMAPFRAVRGETFVPPRMAVVEETLRMVDGDSYLFRLAALPGLPKHWCEAVVRLEGVSVPEGGEPNYGDKVRAESVKGFASLRILGAGLVTLRNFRRDKSSRMLVDVHTDSCDLSALLTEIVREEEEGVPSRGTLCE